MAIADLVIVTTAQRITDAQIILNEINKYRQSIGVPAVQYSKTLSEIVQTESERQIIEESIYHTENFLNDSRSGSYNGAGEVIALQYSRDPAALVRWWIGSPPHEAVLRDPKFSVIGIGIAYADGALQTTGQQWSILSTVNFYGYTVTNRPKDTTASVTSVPAFGIYDSAASGYTTTGAIGRKYTALGGADAIGSPTMNESCGLTGGGCYQEFSKDGRTYAIYWSPTTYAYMIKINSGIGQKWLRDGGLSRYGYPTTDEITTSTEVYQKFSKGFVIHWASGKGVWVT